MGPFALGQMVSFSFLHSHRHVRGVDVFQVAPYPRTAAQIGEILFSMYVSAPCDI